MNEVQKWLESGSYDEGIQLFAKYKKGNHLLTTFSKGPNNYNLLKLRYELDKIKNDPDIDLVSSATSISKPVVPVFIKESASSSVSSKYNHSQHYSMLPDKLKLVANENIVLLKRRDAFSNFHLEEILDDQKRSQQAFDVISLSKDIERNYRALDHFISTGTIQESTEPPKMDISALNGLELMNNLINAQKNLEKHKRELNKLDTGTPEYITKLGYVEAAQIKLESFQTELSKR